MMNGLDLSRFVARIACQFMTKRSSPRIIRVFDWGGLTLSWHDIVTAGDPRRC